MSGWTWADVRRIEGKQPPSPRRATHLHVPETTFRVGVGVFYDIEPVAAPRMTRSDKWAKRPVVERYFAFRDELQRKRVVLPIPARVTFLIRMPLSWPLSKQENMNGQPHETPLDVDNMLKALLDGLYQNDGHVWSVWGEKRWSFTPGILIQPVVPLLHNTKHEQSSSQEPAGFSEEGR